MKKYLMTGMAALAICAAFTSCSKETNLYSEEVIKENTVQDIINNYEAAFIKTFGQPAANQDWGFSDKASTRAGSEPDANLWANYGYKAPAELTAGQRIRVKAYFQSKPEISYVDPGYTDFFVQQVYKGGSDPGAISTEEYDAVNGDPVIGSDHMDHLTFGLKDDGSAKDHIFNFNHGRFQDKNTADPNGTPRNNVQNYPGVTYHNDNGNGTHQDHIMLVLGSSTECVGFISSENSKEHNDCMALASAAVIDAWAEANKEALIASGEYGEAVVDEWNRSFVGLDYEQMELKDAYTNPQQVAKALDFVEDPNNTNYIIYQENIIPYNEFQDFELVGPGNKAVKYLDEQVANMAIGQKMKTKNANNEDVDVTKSTFTKEEWKSELETKYNKTLAGNDKVKVFDLDKVLEYINDDCLPTASDKKMIKNIGGRDGVYSDWIITLTDAKAADLRIICEDLSANEDGNDFDFNDAVIDVYYGEKDHAKAKILAAGGVLGLKVDGKEVHTEFSKANDNIDCAGKMINTNGTNSADANVRSKSLDGLTAPVIPLSKEVKTLAQARDNIIIEVEKEVDGNIIWVKLEAVIGKVASKVRVGTDYQWKDERQYIGDEFKAFVNGTASADDWYQNQLNN